MDMLVTFPAMGADQSHIATGLRRHVHESHAIFYSRHSYGLLVERILGPGQDPAREFKS
jgi:plasmid stabilization system protein ParE